MSEYGSGKTLELVSDISVDFDYQMAMPWNETIPDDALHSIPEHGLKQVEGVFAFYFEWFYTCPGGRLFRVSDRFDASIE